MTHRLVSSVSVLTVISTVLAWGATQGSASSAPADPGPIDGEGYQVVFEDQFNDTTIDRQWALHPPWYDPPPADSIFEGFSVVTLESRESQGYPRLQINTLGQRTGTSYPHYPNARTFTRGNGKYFEARIRYTDTPHSWPAFWLFGAEHPQRWPDSACPTLQGEWDMMENFRWFDDDGQYRNNRFHAAVHRNTSSPCGVDQTSQNKYVDTGMNLTTWHTYGAKWTSGQLCSYVDEISMGCLNEIDTMNQPMYLIISQFARCDSSACAAVPKPAKIALQVDWVRVWSKP